MAIPPANDDQREFRCIHCDGKIHVPRSLPPTTGPCPHCRLQITSPGPEAKEEPVAADPIFGKQVGGSSVGSAPVSPVPAPVAPGVDEEARKAEQVAKAKAAAKVEDAAMVAKARQEAEAKAKADAEAKGRADVEARVQARANAEAKASAAAVVATEAAKVKADAKAEAAVEKAKEAAKAPIDPKAAAVSPELRKDVSLVDEIGGKAGAGNTPRKKGAFPLMAVVVLLLLVAVVVGGVMFVPKLLGPSGGQPTVQAPLNRELREKQYLEGGWEDDAREVLGRFLAAERSAGKAAYSIRGSELLEEMDGFYDGLWIDDSDTPVEAFAVFPLLMKDRERGIFMLTYDQPPVFELNEFFVPLSPLGVQHGVEEPGLLLASVARRSNFTAEPLKVHALFKRTPDGLRVDWETFVQTKYRTMRDFLELPIAGTSKVFRVIISETVPENRPVPAGFRTYMIADPAYSLEDSARVNVAVDSEIGRALSILNWRGTKDGRAISKTATLELGWSAEETPQLEVKKFVCWEFLGVGGEAVPGAR